MMELIASSLRLATPLIFAALGGLICEKSGIATICLEGVLLISAWAAATVDYLTGSLVLSIGAGIAAGVLLMSIHALLAIWAKADHIISGVVVNLFAAGLTPLLTKALFGSPTNTPSIAMEHRLGTLRLPAAADIPGLGPALFSHTPLVYLAWCLPILLQFALLRTQWGLRLMASGDHPIALETAGVSFRKVRLKALLLGGALCSLGGIYLSISHASQFTRGMSAGRGFIALTALIFGKWKPLPTFAACLLFGLADALQIQLQSVLIFGMPFPVQGIQAFPYLITLVVLVGFVGRAEAPLSIGKRI